MALKKYALDSILISVANTSSAYPWQDKLGCSQLTECDRIRDTPLLVLKDYA